MGSIPGHDIPKLLKMVLAPSWDEVLENDRKKLGVDSADTQNRSEWRGHLRERLVKKPNPR